MNQYMTIQEIVEVFSKATRDNYSLYDKNGLPYKDFDSEGSRFFEDKDKEKFKQWCEQVKRSLNDDSMEAEVFRNASKTINGVLGHDKKSIQEFLSMVARGMFKENQRAEYDLLTIAYNDFSGEIRKDIIAAMVKNENAQPRDFEIYSSYIRDPKEMVNLVKVAMEKFDPLIKQESDKPVRNVQKLEAMYTEMKKIVQILSNAKNLPALYHDMEYSKFLDDFYKEIADKYNFDKVMQSERAGLNHFEQMEKNNLEKVTELESKNAELLKQIEQLKAQIAEKDKTITNRDETINNLNTKLRNNEQKYREDIAELSNKNRNLEVTNQVNQRTINMQNDTLANIKRDAENFKSGIGAGQKLADIIKGKIASIEHS